MKIKATLLLVMLSFTLSSVLSQNAPVTVLPHVYNPPLGASFTVPVTVSDFEDIGSISLILNYDASVLTFQGAIPNASFNGMVVNGTTTQGRVVISWYGSYGVSFADGTHLLDLKFLNRGGNTGLNWSLNDDGYCEYAKFNGGAFTVLNDNPLSTYYINGMVTNGTGPLTWAPVINNASPGNIDIPIKVNGFNNIGAVSLTFEYDPYVIKYLDLYTAHSDLASNGSWQVGTQDAPGGKKYLIISWTRNPSVPATPSVSLPDNSTLLTLKFNYLSFEGSTGLKWIDNGSSCEYADGNFEPLEDTPIADFYRDGLVSSLHIAPRIVAPCLTGAVGQLVVFPVKVYGFTGVGAVSLTLDFDPAVLTFQSMDPVGIPSGWSKNSSATTGKFKLGSFGNGFSLPDGSILFNISFLYQGGSCLLTWYDEDGSSCEYADAATMLPLYDLPRENFYINGCIGPAPTISAKTFLEGPYNKSTKEMTTLLNSQGLIPLYQPYNTAPWNYNGTENSPAISADITDWVLVQLRTSPQASTTIATRAGLLTKSGAIMDMSGTRLLAFPGIDAGYYYLAIIHRNHIAVISATAIEVNPKSSMYDFSIGPSSIYGYPYGLKEIDPSIHRWGMVAGDASNDQNIYMNDYTDFWAHDFGLSPVYCRGDFNMDGSVFINDFTDYWGPNFGRSNVLP